MRTFTIAAASALLLAYLITELVSRFWPNQYVALLIAATVALLVNGLFNARLAVRAAPARPSKGKGGSKQRKRPNQSRNDRGRNNQGGRDRGRKERRDAKPAAAPSGPTEQGEVKWFNRSKGYGFIIRENGEEIFVHQRSIVADPDARQRPVLRDGQKVKFIVTHQDKGAQAEQVQPLD